jgi:cytoskeletal protein CcmA (bactofilin family)
VASDLPNQPEKISADCPHCGYSQLESLHAKTTFCRKCGQHYAIERVLSKEATSLKPPGFFARLTKSIAGEKERTIHCHSCGHKQIVSTSAQSSLCPACASYLDLRDLKVAGPYARTIQTQGDVTVTPKGDLASVRVACGNAWIEGKVRGRVVCLGTVHVKLKGTMLATIETARLVVDKKSEVEFARPVRAKTIEIAGRAAAVLHCDGCVKIVNGGVFAGTIYARAVDFEKGGFFSGELHIGEKAVEQAEMLTPLEKEQPGLYVEPAVDLPPAPPPVRTAVARKRA